MTSLWFNAEIETAQAIDRAAFPIGFEHASAQLQALCSALLVWRNRCGTRKGYRASLWLTQRQRHRDILVRTALDYGMPRTAEAIKRNFDNL